MARGEPVDLGRAGAIHAVLGPTNTGKTHVALQRMMAHRTGMIGLPLRLLAREVYDRVCAEKGADQVALVTGEEKRVGAQARYWVCTTESMPVDRPVAFLAVDEVQLATDPDRGHVFTDRILRARGVGETWFLGADTMGPVLQELVPTVQIRSQPRLSRLSYAGHRKLTALPPRAAVVCFSVARVYALAERLRARHGGAAVVMGALSPRARNAQVELFQSGAVDHLVATDAIGMGLNLDVHHVALADSAKFDGREHRPLRPDELAQIAGRAGRWRRDGTFGTTAGAEPLDPEVVEAIEQHRFPPVRRVRWRNHDLAYDDVDALLESLDASPPRRLLVPVRAADDHRALRTLAEDADVRALVGRDAARVALLWDVCGIPDFGNVLPEHHATLLGQVLRQLLEHDGVLPDDWVDAQVRRLDRVEGDIPTLMARIAGIRVWTYLANRGDWLADAAAWQARTRDLEDRVSDALHEQLTARFVDRRHAVFVRASTTSPEPVLHADGRIEAGGEPLGRLVGLDVHLDPVAGASPPVRKAIHALVRGVVAERLDTLVDAPDGAFSVDDDGTVCWDGAPVAKLAAGDDWRRPWLRVRRTDWLEGDARGRLVARLEAWRARWLADLPAPLDADAVRAPAARGLVHVLASALGMVPRREVEDLVRALPRGAKRWLVDQGVVFGQRWVLHPVPAARARERAVLWRVAHGDGPVLDDGGVAPRRPAWPREAAVAMGFDRVAGWTLRADVLEALLSGGQPAAEQLGLDPALPAALQRALGPPARRHRRGRR